MIFLNFSHPLTAVHRAAIEQLTGQPIERMVEVKTHFDHSQSFAAQGRILIEQIGLSAEEWQTSPIVVNPPSLSPVACLVLAELHGHMGYFPPVLRLRPVSGRMPPAFEVAEIINLQAVRDTARARR